MNLVKERQKTLISHIKGYLAEKLKSLFSNKQVELSNLIHRLPDHIIQVIQKISSLDVIIGSEDYVVEEEGFSGSGGICRRIIYKKKFIFIIKKISMDNFGDQDYVRLSREIDIHSGLSHSNIPQLYTKFIEDNCVYILMQYGGEDLSEISINDVGDMNNFIGQLVSTVAYLHQNMIIHRDIKPPNIVICEGKLLYLVDFGHSVKVTKLNKNRRSYGCGTEGYKAPEIKSHQEYSFPVDVYSIGRVIRRICTGDDEKISNAERKMSSIDPSKRGDINEWCQYFNCVPVTKIEPPTETSLPIKVLFPSIFTDQRMDDGSLELILSPNRNQIDKTICFSLIKELQMNLAENSKKRKYCDEIENPETTKFPKLSEDVTMKKEGNTHPRISKLTNDQVILLKMNVVRLLFGIKDGKNAKKILEMLQEDDSTNSINLSSINLGKKILAPLCTEKKLIKKGKKKYFLVT